MSPRNDDIARLAPDLIEAMEPAEVEALARALADPEAGPEVRAALAHWATLRGRVAHQLARDYPRRPLLALYAVADDPLALSAEEEQQLEAARPALEAALERHPGLYAVVDRLRADRDAFLTIWEEAAAEPMQRPAHRHGGHHVAADRPAAPRAARATPVHRWAWRSATALALALFVAFSVFLLQRDAGFETVSTAAGETRVIDLPDGTTVRLASHTTLAYETRNDGERRVRLTAGEAVFEVVPDAQPFIVETPVALATVLGTTFGVRADERATEVVLASGAVELASRTVPEAAVRLEPGQRSLVVAGRIPETPARTDIVETLAWTGTWYFHATPLSAIAERLAAYYDVSVAVPPALAEEQISGAFEQEAPVEQTLRTLAAALGVRVEGDAARGFRFAPAAG
jgi:transmembrane sensor